MARFVWENGRKIDNAYVRINGTRYDVNDALVEGETPLSAESLNLMEDDIYEELNNVNEKVDGIIESGENSNGSWIKYADGTMICYGTKSGTSSLVDYWNFTNRMGINNIQFSQTFTNIPVINVTPYGNATVALTLEGATTSNFNINVYKAKNATNNNYTIHYVAIGKWK